MLKFKIGNQSRSWVNIMQLSGQYPRMQLSGPSPRMQLFGPYPRIELLGLDHMDLRPKLHCWNVANLPFHSSSNPIYVSHATFLPCVCFQHNATSITKHSWKPSWLPIFPAGYLYACYMWRQLGVNQCTIMIFV